jgi:hypothetical protein
MAFIKELFNFVSFGPGVVDPKGNGCGRKISHGKTQRLQHQFEKHKIYTGADGLAIRWGGGFYG